MKQSRPRYRTSAEQRLRAVLVSEFARRQQTNKRYSLRAFARSVGIEHSTLSQLLRGTRTMTWKSIQLLAERTRWTGNGVLRLSNEGRRFDSRQVAERLGISVDEVNIALTDLCMFGLVELKGE